MERDRASYEVKVEQYLFWRSPSPPPSSETSLQLQLRLQRHTQSALAKENSASATRHSSSQTLYPFTLGICRDLPPSRPSFALPLSQVRVISVPSLATAFPPLCSLDTANSLTLPLSQLISTRQWRSTEAPPFWV